MNRNRIILNGDEIISSNEIEISWVELKSVRNIYLKKTDKWYYPDRYETLSEDFKNKINNYRHLLRELPQTYDNANDAWDNFPMWKEEYKA
tara:strand:- start:19 stop:291 length:273 start_codon:yes stop_codon:yes gene_type:complete